jgi:hypothetical protein
MPFDGREFDQRRVMLEKLDGVIDLLGSEDRWCKHRLRSNDGRRCIMGALMDVDAISILTQPILAAAHELTGKSYSHIERFNDHTKTDYRLVSATLRRARENITLGKTAPAPSMTVARRVRIFSAALARLTF